MQYLSSKAGNKAIDFFYYLSNTDPELKDRASHWGRAKALLVGVLITLSSTLAGISMFYFVYSAIENFFAAFLFAVLWTLTVAHIEKSVYLSTSKWAVIVRILMILVISMLVSLPLKIALFADALNDQVRAMQHEQKIANYQDVATQEAKASGMRHQFNRELAEMENERTQLIRKRDAEAGGLTMHGASGATGKGPKYRALDQQVKLMDQAIEKKKEQINRAEGQAVADVQKAQKLYDMKNEGISESNSFFYKYKGYKRLLASSDPLTATTTMELSIIIYLVLILIELSPVLLKALLPHTDMDHEAIKGQQLIQLTQDYRNDTMAHRMAHIGRPEYTEETDEEYQNRIGKYSKAISEIAKSYRDVS